MFKFFFKSAPKRGYASFKNTDFKLPCLPTLQSAVVAADNNKKTTQMANVIAKSLFNQHLKEGTDALASGTLVPLTPLKSNGNLIRYAYEATLKQLLIMQQFGHFGGVIGGPDDPNIISSTSFKQKLRESTRMIAHDSMSDPKEVNHLKERNKVIYGSDKLTLDLLVKKKLATNPNLLFINALKAVDSSFARSNAQYNEKFGLAQAKPIVPSFSPR